MDEGMYGDYDEARMRLEFGEEVLRRLAAAVAEDAARGGPTLPGEVRLSQVKAEDVWELCRSNRFPLATFVGDGGDGDDDD